MHTLKFTFLRLYNNKKFFYFSIIVLCVCFFIAIYGPFVINPGYTAWLEDGDLACDYINYRAFLNDQWRFPIGITNQLAFPNFTFIGGHMMLFLPLKIFKNILSANFQPFGIYALINFILMGVLAYKIISRFTKNKWFTLLSSCTFIVSPPLIQRMFMHTSLQTQWIILLAIDISISIYKKEKSKTREIISLCILSILSVSTHFYFFPMCFLIILGITVHEILERGSAKPIVEYLFPFITTGILFIALYGGFTSIGDAFTDSGFGYYSANLNTYINPMDFSLIFKSLSTTPGQYEGFAYIGFGIAVLFVISFVLFALTNNFKDFFRKRWRILIPFAVISLIVVIFSTSNIVSFNDKIIFKINLPPALLNMLGAFRASGRFAWINTYFVFISSFYLITKVNFKNRSLRHIKPAIILTCVMLQFIDLSKSFSNYNKQYNHIIHKQQFLKETQFWNQIIENNNIKHAVFTFNFEELLASPKNEFGYSIAEFCIKNHLTINTFNYGRGTNIFDKSIDDYLDNYKNSYFYISLIDKPFACINNPLLKHYLVDNLYVSTEYDIEGYIPCEPTFNYEFNQKYIINGEDINGVRYLYNGGSSFGNYQILPKGKYKINIKGANLNNCDYLFTTNRRKQALDLKQFVKTNDDVQYEIEVPDRCKECEIIINNQSKETVEIQKITMSSLQKH